MITPPAMENSVVGVVGVVGVGLRGMYVMHRVKEDAERQALFCTAVGNHFLLAF